MHSMYERLHHRGLLRTEGVAKVDSVQVACAWRWHILLVQAPCFLGGNRHLLFVAARLQAVLEAGPAQRNTHLRSHTHTYTHTRVMLRSLGWTLGVCCAAEPYHALLCCAVLRNAVPCCAMLRCGVKR